MPVVAIEGRAGSLAPDLAHVVADRLEIDSIDRLMLAEIARKVGATVQAVSQSERRPTGVVDRLAGLVQRMLERSAVAGTGGDPVLELQTNFGGGKTHSMLALYHLFSGVETGSLEGIETVLADAGVNTAPKASRAVGAAAPGTSLTATHPPE